MKVTSHQPDLLPYSGFWFKMAMADVFDLKVYDQFQARGYQRRVRMRDSWASLQVVGKPSRERIVDVRIRNAESRQSLTRVIEGRYRGSRNWDSTGPLLLDLVDSVRTDHLWQFNLELILGVRDLLGITTPVAIAPAPRGRRSAGLVDVLGRYGADTYLAGTGGRAYMGDCHEFTAAGIGIEWSRHRASTGDSIVSVLMDSDDPISVVLATDGAPEEVAS